MTNDEPSETDPPTDQFDLPTIRHVVTDQYGDEPGFHLTTTETPDVALCGQRIGGLRLFGQPTESLIEATRLGAWVNGRPDMCPECRDAFNEVIFSDE